MRKNKVKRYAAVMLAIVLIGGLLTGCEGAGREMFGQGPDKTATAVEPGKDPEPSVTQAPTSEPTPEVTEPVQPEPVANGPAHVKVMTGKGYDSVYQDGETLSYVTYPTVFLDDADAGKYPELAKALEQFSIDKRTKAEDSKDSLAEMKRQYMADETWESSYYDITVVRVARADSVVVSLCENGSFYAGGVHDMFGEYGYVFDSESGKQLDLEDIVYDSARPRLAELIYESLEKTYADVLMTKDEELKSMIEQNYIAEGQLKWYLSYGGLVALFNPYELASFADGVLRVTVPFDGNGDIFVDKFMDKPESYSFDLFDRDKELYDIGDDGKLDEITVEGQRGEYGDITQINVTVNGKTETREVYAYAMTAQIYRVDDGTDVLLVEEIEDNDYNTIFSFKLTENGPIYVDSYGYGFMSVEKNVDDSMSYYCNPCFSPDTIALSKYRDILGTNGVWGEFELTSQGELKKKGRYMNYSTERELMLLQELSVFEGEEFDNMRTTTLRPGSVIVPLYITEMDGVIARTEDGGLVSFYVQTQSWPEKIDGVDVSEIFEGIMYAG